MIKEHQEIIDCAKKILSLRYSIFKDELSYLVSLVVFVTVLLLAFGVISIGIYIYINSLVFYLVEELTSSVLYSYLTIFVVNFGFLYAISSFLKFYIKKSKTTVMNLLEVFCVE